MNGYTEAVNYIEKYIEATALIFETARQFGNFDDAEGQLHQALRILKEQGDYEDFRAAMN